MQTRMATCISEYPNSLRECTIAQLCATHEPARQTKQACPRRASGIPHVGDHGVTEVLARQVGQHAPCRLGR